jgi:hypothetical protein
MCCVCNTFLYLITLKYHSKNCPYNITYNFNNYLNYLNYSNYSKYLNYSNCLYFLYFSNCLYNSHNSYNLHTILYTHTHHIIYNFICNYSYSLVRQSIVTYQKHFYIHNSHISNLNKYQHTIAHVSNLVQTDTIHRILLQSSTSHFNSHFNTNSHILNQHVYIYQ